MRAALVLCFLIGGVLRETSAYVAQDLNLVAGAPVNMLLGPENAIYCRLEDPSRIPVYDGFGRCVLNIDRTHFLHIGFWRMYVGEPGKINTEMHLFRIKLRSEEPRPEVRMSATLSNDNSVMTISCSVETTSAPGLCEFRLRGMSQIAQEGVDDGLHSFYGDGVSHENGKYTMNCGLRISSPSVMQLGTWRCGVQTEVDIFYGFLFVNFPSLVIIDPPVEPWLVLIPHPFFEDVEVGSSQVMLCTISSSIRYCYFRSENGTHLSVSPGESTDTYEYVGNGLDAGECGIRLKAVSVSDGGRWSCHVGLVNGTTPEQNATIRLTVEETMVASLSILSDRSVMVSAVVRNLLMPLEYCRFVRRDGFGFTHDFLPEGYELNEDLSFGRCNVRILRPTAFDLQRWTVAVRLRGRPTEVVARTQDISASYRHSSPMFIALRVTVITLCVGLVLMAFVLLFWPEKNRKWTRARAAAVRNSIRRSFQKTPKPEADRTVTSPQAA